MSGTTGSQQARIEALVASSGILVENTRLKATAERGMIAPESLSFEEIRRMCCIVSAHFTIKPMV